jgi:hypothetical protein
LRPNTPAVSPEAGDSDRSLKLDFQVFHLGMARRGKRDSPEFWPLCHARLNSAEFSYGRRYSSNSASALFWA